MNNPWIGLSSKAPFIAELDKDIVETSPKAFGHVRFEIPPDPYLGNLEKAKIVLLVLNPGFVDEDIVSFKNKGYIEQNKKNLTHQAEPGFYVLNEKFSFSGGYRWWMRILKRPIEDGVSTNSLADKLLCLQYFPYHSPTYTHIPTYLPSQHYTTHFLFLERRLNRTKQ